MTVDYRILATLSDPMNREVLHTIAAGRAVRLGQLMIRGERSRVLQAIGILKGAELIKETPSPIEELKTYFVTASGLQADRMVRG